jgi:hypothetical protein
MCEDRAVAQAVCDFTQQKPSFNLTAVFVKFVVDNAALGIFIFQNFGFPLPVIIPSTFHTHLSPLVLCAIDSIGSIGQQIIRIFTFDSSYCWTQLKKLTLLVRQQNTKTLSFGL